VSNNNGLSVNINIYLDKDLHNNINVEQVLYSIERATYSVLYVIYAASVAMVAGFTIALARAAI
jgi:hypothetical protein